MAGLDGPSLWLSNLHTQPLSSSWPYPEPHCFLQALSPVLLFFSVSWDPMDPLLLLSSKNPDPHSSQSPSPGTADMVKGTGKFSRADKRAGNCWNYSSSSNMFSAAGSFLTSRRIQSSSLWEQNRSWGNPRKLWEQILSGWMGDIQRSLAANVPLLLWNQITLSGAPSERNGYESWVVIKDSFRCRDSE